MTIEGVVVPEAAVSVRRPKGKWHTFFDVISPLIWCKAWSARWTRSWPAPKPSGGR